MASEQPWQSYHTVFTNAKAGMDGVDKDKVQKVVYEMSKGSRYFENEQRKEASIQQRVQHMQAQAARLTVADLTNYEKMADSKLAELEASRDLSRIWMHVDLDAFYAAVETLEDPSLVGKAMAVGGMSMICTANYEARKFGVRAAMPGFIACKLCPDLIFVRPNFDKYTWYSEQVRQVFREYDPQFVARSLDEAYLDITDQCSLRCMSSGEVAEELRRRVHEKTGLTCSAGLGPNRMIAKVCSDMNKPNGQFSVPNVREAVVAFVSTLPIRKVSGIGKVTEHLLKEVLGINICGDLINKRALITALFSPISSDFFLSVGLGIGGSDTPQEEPRKSLSCERTFSTISCEKSLYIKLEELADNLAKDLAAEGLQGRTLTLKLKTTDFEVRTRSLSLPFLIHKKEDLMFHSSKLLKAELPLSLRLMGLRISHFQGDVADPSQRTLADFICTNSMESGKVLNPDAENIDQLHPSFYSSQTVGLQQLNNMGHESMNSLPSGIFPEMADTEASSITPLCGSAHSPEALPDSRTRQTSEIHSESTSTSGRIPRRSQVKYLFQKCVKNSDSCSHAGGVLPNNFMLESQTEFQAHDCDTFMESSFPCMMVWVDDKYCSLCGLEIPASFAYERQEHSDFHYAQRLQQEYSKCRQAVNMSQDLKEQSKRHHSPTSKERASKKPSIAKPESSRQRNRNIPIDAFFSKT